MSELEKVINLIESDDLMQKSEEMFRILFTTIIYIIQVVEISQIRIYKCCIKLMGR
jgi:hypothetical protein